MLFTCFFTWFLYGETIWGRQPAAAVLAPLSGHTCWIVLPVCSRLRALHGPLWVCLTNKTLFIMVFTWFIFVCTCFLHAFCMHNHVKTSINHEKLWFVHGFYMRVPCTNFCQEYCKKACKKQILSCKKHV
jgi:hypothetical protein